MLPPTFSFSLVALGALNQSRRAKTLWYFGGKIPQLVSMASSRQQQQVWWFQCVDKLYKVTQVQSATAHDGLWDSINSIYNPIFYKPYLNPLCKNSDQCPRSCCMKENQKKRYSGSMRRVPKYP